MKNAHRPLTDPAKWPKPEATGQKHEILHSVSSPSGTEWFNISRYRDYHYYHHPTGLSIAVLPYVPPLMIIKNESSQLLPERLTSGQHQGFVGLRKEDLPCWQAAQAGADQLNWTCVTGGVNDREDPDDAMIRELREELGLRLDDVQVTKTHPMFAGKGGNLRVIHYFVTVWKGVIFDISPDSPFEAAAENVWIPVPTLNVLREQFDLHTSHLVRMGNLL